MMVRLVVPTIVAGLATLFVAFPISVGAAPDAPGTLLHPKRLVVDSTSAPVLSVDQTTQRIEIVLVPEGEYRPVHPDSLEATEDRSSDQVTAQGVDGAAAR